MSSIRTWVHDSLLKLTGSSEDLIVDFVLANATDAKSPDSLQDKLSELLTAQPQALETFARELYTRTSRKHNGSPSTKSISKEKEGGAKESRKRYKLLEMDDEPRKVASEKEEKKSKRPKTDSTNSRSERHKAQKLRRRDKGDFDSRWADEEYEEEEEQWETSSAKKRKLDDGSASPVQELDPEIQRELERAKERQEVEAFSKRLNEKGKKTVEDHSSSSFQGKLVDERRSLASDAAARDKAMPEIRNRARQAYLQKREAEKLSLFRLQVADEERELQDNPDLSRAEREEFEKNRKILELAEARLRVDDKQDGYMLPADYITERGTLDRKAKEAALYRRDVDRNERGEERHVTDHQFWEMDQVAKAKTQIASRDLVDDGSWGFVLDEAQQINFVAEQAVRQPKLSLEQQQLELRLKEARSKAATIQEQRKSLPVYQWREEFLKAMTNFQTIVVVAETGAGKSTQLPQYALEAGYAEDGKKIAVTQPRRVAAMSVAKRVAEEAGCKLGKEISYSVRFDNCVSDDTKITYLTDGMLLREMLAQPDLSDYSVIMIDEAHERTVSSDLLFGLLSDLSRARPDLKLLISSATVDAEKFSLYFNNAPIFRIPGRTHPIQELYTAQPEADYLRACISTIFQIHLSQGPGDILVFLTGEADIVEVNGTLEDISRRSGKLMKELIIRPIYASMPADDQQRVFEITPPNARKVVLATNIAETSLTIDGIKYVVDPGFVKENVYNPRTGMESLITTPISRASAKQRAGRAGRVGPGMVFRLFTKFSYWNELEETPTPEIQRTSMDSVVLTLKCLGINDILEFDFMDPPPASCIIGALENLYSLGCLNDRGELTKVGRQMAELPISPKLARSLLAAHTYGCVEPILSIISLLSETGLFIRPADKRVHADSARARFTNKEGDHLTLLNVWNEFEESDFSMIWARENFLDYRTLKRARDVREQLVGLCDRVEVPMSSSEDTVAISKAIATGFFSNVARLRTKGDGYSTLKTNIPISIHPSSVLMGQNPPPKFIIFDTLMLSSKEYARTVSIIDPKILTEVAPHVHKKDAFEKK